MGGKKKVETVKIKTQENKDLKLLLLGSGESGKSTIHKQIKMLYNEGYHNNKKEIEAFKNSIYSNIITLLFTLGEYITKNDMEFKDSENKGRVEAITELANDPELLTTSIDKYTVEVHEILKKIWADKAVQELFIKKPKDVHIFDGAAL
jgi:guanine nucleotide-binding protein G(i) subunit alpha